MRSQCSHILSGNPLLPLNVRLPLSRSELIFGLDACPCLYTDGASSCNSFIMFVCIEIHLHMQKERLCHQMPYLHWETDRKYRQMATITKGITSDPQKLWIQSSNEMTRKFWTPLGTYLFYVSEVYSRMDVAQDRALLETYLRKQPPLHGRRTLAQSYYSKLEDTGPRDEDQVVYRGTAPTPTTRIIMVDQLWLYILDDRMFHDV